MSDELKTGYVQGEGRVMTPIGRMMWVHLFEPQKPDAKNKLKDPKYGAWLMFLEDADLSLLKTLRQTTANDFFGDKLADAEFAKALRNPIHDQKDATNAEGQLYDGAVPGAKFIKVSANVGYQPTLVGADGATLTEPRQLYAGCWARAIVNAFGYDTGGKQGNKGISFGVLGVQKIKDDKPFGKGSVATASDFKPVVSKPAADAVVASASSSGAGSVFDD